MTKITAVKKIFYIPGLISALLIPILLWYYGSQKIEDANLRVIDIGLPARLTKDNYNFFFETYRNWNYKKIIVKPNTALQNQQYYVSELKKLQKRNQKETGIEFILDKNNTYGDFVSLLNDMAVAKQETYAYDLEKTGHVFATVNYIDPKAKKLKEECLLCNDTIGYYIPEEYSFNIFKIETLINLPQKAYYIIFGFLLFLNISMLSIKERFQLQKFHY